MMNTNSDNPKVGKLFQQKVLKLAEKRLGIEFDEEIPLQIGNPATPHKFDCVSINQKIVIECKCYTWTNTGNVPSAKTATLNEAILYMSCLPKDIYKIFVLKKASHPKKHETFAEYYCRRFGHLLGDIEVWEVDNCDRVKVIREGNKL